MVEVQLRKQVFEQRCCLETFRPHPEIGPLLLQNSVKETHWSVASKDWSCTKCWSNLGPSFPDTASCWRTLVQKMADESIPSWKYDKQLESSSTVYPFIPTSLSGRMSWQWTVDIFFLARISSKLDKVFFWASLCFGSSIHLNKRIQRPPSFKSPRLPGLWVDAPPRSRTTTSTTVRSWKCVEGAVITSTSLGRIPYICDMVHTCHTCIWSIPNNIFWLNYDISPAWKSLK